MNSLLAVFILHQKDSIRDNSFEDIMDLLHSPSGVMIRVAFINKSLISNCSQKHKIAEQRQLTFISDL